MFTKIEACEVLCDCPKSCTYRTIVTMVKCGLIPVGTTQMYEAWKQFRSDGPSNMKPWGVRGRTPHLTMAEVRETMDQLKNNQSETLGDDEVRHMIRTSHVKKLSGQGLSTIGGANH